MTDFRQDLVYAVRKLRSAPAFTITVILTLALGIGANTAIFSVVNGVLLKPLSFPQPDRVVSFRFSEAGNGDAAAPPDLADYRARSRSFQQIAMFEGKAMNLVRDGSDPLQLTGVRASANWFDLVRVRPVLGRAFLPGEDDEGAQRVVILSDDLWRRVFSADPAIVGRPIRLNGDDYTVIGVLPPKRGYLAPELWTPLVFTAREKSDVFRNSRWLNMIGRLADGVSVEAAQAELARISSQIGKEMPQFYDNRVVRPVLLQDDVVGDLRKPLLVIMGAVGFVLLIACANVANLFLVRASGRAGELAIRTALGAGRSRLIRQLVTEAVLLTCIGAAAGLAIATWGMSVLLTLAPSDLPRVGSASIDGAALGVTAAIALITGVFFGVLPAFQRGGGSDDLAAALRAGGRGARSRHSANRAKRAIVVAEVALAVALLTGAGLLLRSFQRLLSVDLGFKPQGVLTFRVTLPDRGYYELAPRRNFVRALEERLHAIPGVRTVAASNGLPLDGSDMTLSFTVRGHAPVKETQEPSAQIIVATTSFFEAQGISIVRGRGFTPDDREGGPRVVVVNREFVRRFFPNEEPIGQYIDLGWRVDGERQGGQIVGIAADVKQRALDQGTPPLLYAPFAQSPVPNLRWSVRAAVPPATLATAVRAAVRETDRELPIFALRTLEEYVSRSVGPQRFYAVLVGLFATVALVLAGVGLYGVIAYVVSQQTHELGVRVALGASGERITRMVVGQGIAMTIIGVAIGLAAALALTRVLSSLLFGVGAADPLTFVAVAVLLVLVAAAASYLPARRAGRVDPLVAMRGE
jgi:putative ABC transport system permease protein